MNQHLPHVEHSFRGNSLALRSADLVRSLAGWAWRQFTAVSILTVSNAMADKLRSGNPDLHLRTLLQIGLMALACGLVLGRIATAGSLEAQDTAPAQDVSDRAAMPVQASCDALAGVVRVHGGWILRWGKSPRAF